MPILGDAPITSYFSRAPSISKRKGRVELAEVSTGHKRRKQTASTTDEHVSDLPTTFPLPHTPIQQGEAFALPTPPETGVGPSHRRKVVTKSQPVFDTPAHNPLSQLQLSTISPITPTTTIRPRHRFFPVATGGNSLKNLTKPFVSAAPSLRLGQHCPDSPKDSKNIALQTTDGVIPSSQSPEDTGPMEANIPSLDAQPVALQVVAPSMQKATPTLRDFSNECITPCDDDGGAIIGSSQSQPSLFIPNSPRKWQTSPIPLAAEDTMSSIDLIPSSQSQENELIMPRPRTSRMSNSRGHSRQLFPVRGTNDQPRIPHRTFSDELFSFPIQNSILDDLFLVEDAENNRDSPKRPKRPKLYDSLTESENEGEQSSTFTTASRIPATHSSQISQSSVGWDQGSSCASLPDAVKDFQQMFTNVEESYPADFPESLRS